MRNPLILLAGFSVELLVILLVIDTLWVCDLKSSWALSVLIFVGYLFLALAGKAPSQLAFGLRPVESRSMLETFRFVIRSINEKKFPAISYAQTGAVRIWVLPFFLVLLVLAIDLHGSVVVRYIQSRTPVMQLGEGSSAIIAIRFFPPERISCVSLRIGDEVPTKIVSCDGADTTSFFPLLSSISAPDEKRVYGIRPLLALYLMHRAASSP